MKGRAHSIDYDPTAKQAVLTGDAVVEHPSGEARGARLTYDVDTGKMSGDGQGGDGRVHLRMAPKPKDSGADKDKAKGVEKKPDGGAEKGAAAAASPGAPAQPS